MSANTVVRTNVLSLNAHRNLGLVSNQQARSSQRLSSGFRINSAADDAAGLGISEKMRAQIRGLDQASRNAQDGISLIQTAEGALGTVNDILIRVRELVIQAANDTNVGGDGSQSDRLRIQDEIDQLMDEIDSIAARTEFNTRTLLDGGLSQEGVVRGGEWTSVDSVRTLAPARIQTLDQLLRTTSNTAFVGSFSDLLTRIGADLDGRTADQWLAMETINFDNLADALDAAMGVTATSAGRWADLQTKVGLTFVDAEDMLDAFVRGLHNPNALREGAPGGAPQTFTNWQNFVENANEELGAGTFARAESTAGGEAIWEALLRSDAFRTSAGLSAVADDNNYSFNDVRNAFYQMGGNLAAESGWAISNTPMATWLNVNTTDGPNSWLETRFGAQFMGATGGTTTSPVPGVFDSAAAWDHFTNRYLTAETTIVQRDVWVPSEAERDRGVALWFQIGANSGQGINVEIGSMSTGTLFGREGSNHTQDRRIINVLDVFGYNVQDGRLGGSNYGHVIGDNVVDTLLEAVDSALAIATRQRSELGAVQNRLEFAIENLDIASENLQASESRIRDADMAREMMRLTQANVLQQAAISMLAQANQAPQSVLQLLG